MRAESRLRLFLMPLAQARFSMRKGRLSAGLSLCLRVGLSRRGIVGRGVVGMTAIGNRSRRHKNRSRRARRRRRDPDAQARGPTPAGDYAGTLAAIAALVAQVEARTGERGSVGVATPGALSLKTGLIKNANSVVLNGRPLDRDLAEILNRPVRIENDANCFTLRRRRMAREPARARSSASFSGQGVGGGLVIDGRARLWGATASLASGGIIRYPGRKAPSDRALPAIAAKRAASTLSCPGPSLARDYLARAGISA